MNEFDMKARAGWQGDVLTREDNGITYTMRRVGDRVETHNSYEDTVDIYVQQHGTKELIRVACANRSGRTTNVQGYELSAGRAAEFNNNLVLRIDVAGGNRTSFSAAINDGAPIGILAENWGRELFLRELRPVPGQEFGYRYSVPAEKSPKGAEPSLDGFDTSYQIYFCKGQFGGPSLAAVRTAKKTPRGCPLKPDTRYLVRNGVVFEEGNSNALAGVVDGCIRNLRDDLVVWGGEKGLIAELAEKPKGLFRSGSAKLKYHDVYLCTPEGLKLKHWTLALKNGKTAKLGDVELDNSHRIDVQNGKILKEDGSSVATFSLKQGSECLLLADVRFL